MGEDIEIRDIHGNVVKVPLYGTLSFMADHLAARIPEGTNRIETSTTTRNGIEARLVVSKRERGSERSVDPHR
jgi:hypothetical protein